MASSSKTLGAAQKTALSLKSIHETLDPFLRILRDENSRDESDPSTSVDPQTLAEAEAAVALTLGTLRYISSRLAGKKTDSGLKMELDKMKKIVVRLMKKRKQRKMSKKTELAAEKNA